MSQYFTMTPIDCGKLPLSRGDVTYDVWCPCELTLQPLESYTFTLPFTLHLPHGCMPCFSQRESLRGSLSCLPQDGSADEKLQLRVMNISKEPIHLTRSDFIATMTIFSITRIPCLSEKDTLAPVPHFAQATHYPQLVEFLSWISWALVRWICFPCVMDTVQETCLHACENGVSSKNCPGAKQE